MTSVGNTSISSKSITQPKVPTVEAATGTTAASELQVSKKKPAKSDIWDHVTKMEKEHGSKAGKAKCNYCDTIYSYSSLNGTSTLWKHFRNCKKYPANMVDKRQKTLNFQNSGLEGETQLVNWKFDQELCRKALAKMIIIDELPFKFVEREGFRYFCNVMQPKFKIVSRTTIGRDCLELYASEKKKLKNALASEKKKLKNVISCGGVGSSF